MDDNSFTGPIKGIQQIMSKSESAYVHSKEVIFGSDEYKNCMIDLIPWQQRIGANAMILQNKLFLIFIPVEYSSNFNKSGPLQIVIVKWLISNQLVLKRSLFALFGFCVEW